jgi:hypothetical protein
MMADDGGRGLSIDDRRSLECAHAALDELGVPRANERGRLTIFGRIEALRAGQFDPERLSRSTGAAMPLHPCPRCGLLALVELGAVCPSCSAALLAPLPAEVQSGDPRGT